jgi:GNAT superfamily N-acetyltransferase
VRPSIEITILPALRLDSSDMTSITVRGARPSDSARLAELSTQLGYATSCDQAMTRLRTLLSKTGEAVLVAQGPDGGVVGWLHVMERHLIESPPFAELGGLVVDERHRRTGVGRALVEAAERWGRERGMPSMRIRTNVIREAAHEFYTRLGYSLEKRQSVFMKQLLPAGGEGG